MTIGSEEADAILSRFLFDISGTKFSSVMQIGWSWAGFASFTIRVRSPAQNLPVGMVPDTTGFVPDSILYKFKI